MDTSADVDDSRFTTRSQIPGHGMTTKKSWWLFGGGASGHDGEKTLDIFKSAPKVTIKSVRIENDWPVKTVEFEIELMYNGTSWESHISKSNIYRLWFFIKGHGYMNNNAPDSPNNQRSGLPGPQNSFHTLDIPQLRHFLFANSQRSTTPEMVALIQDYLNVALAIAQVRSSAYVLSLFQISGGTFDDEMHVTSKREGWLKVRCWLKGNRDNVRINRGAVMCDNSLFNCFCVVKKYSWQTSHWKWVVLKDSCLAIYDSNRDSNPKEVMLFDAKFKLEFGLRAVGSTKDMVISNSAYVLHVQARHRDDALKWANVLRQSVEASEWSQNYRDESFAVPRVFKQVATRAQWFVDGEDTYTAMFAAIRAAKKDIFIAGWWICPHTYLLRPPSKYPHSRLDLLLKERAEAGVNIYILMYKEVKVALTLDSMYAKKTLRQMHRNIHVLRDPDFIIKQLGMWSHHEKIVCVDQSVAFVGGLDLCFGRWDNAKHSLFDDEDPKFPGKDFSNPRIKDFVQVNQPDVDLMDRDANPRMPWHDVHCKLFGEPARDVARHFIQRWNYSVSTRFKSYRFQHLLPAFVPPRAAPPSSPLARQSTGPMPAKRKLLAKEDRGFSRFNFTINDDDENDDEETKADEPSSTTDEGFNCSCQIVRSISLWSGGCPTEKSIQNAYIRLIGAANHFVYIENQFFVSGIEGDTLCQNRIANAIVSRILRAFASNETFRVMVVMPLFPSFQGKPQEKDAYSLRGVMHWQYRSICRGEGSIYQQLLTAGIREPFHYIAFFGLRTHNVHKGIPHTEEVYIHSKTMVVDDRATIIGSANINERSMLGDRDSEIAVVVEDAEWVAGVTMGNGSAVGKFSHSFRMRLFEEHLGVTPDTPAYDALRDPVDDHTWFAIQDQAMDNTNIYEAVFGCLPADCISSFGQMGVAFVSGNKKTPESFEMVSKSASERPPSPVGAAPAPAPPVAATKVGEQTRQGSVTGLVFTGAMRALRQQTSVMLERTNQLENVRGHIVYFPLKFLEKENLEPTLIPAEVFQ